MPFLLYQSKAKSTENTCPSVKGKLCSFGLIVVVATDLRKGVAATTTTTTSLLKKLKTISIRRCKFCIVLKDTTVGLQNSVVAAAVASSPAPVAGPLLSSIWLLSNGFRSL